MCTPQSEVHQLLPGCREHHAGCLRRDDRLKMHQVDQPGLNQLRLRQLCDYTQHRFVGEEGSALRHRIDIPGEAQVGQAFDKGRREHA